MSLAGLRREFDWILQNWFTWSAPVRKRCITDPGALQAGFTRTQAARQETG
jgi:hypothetical protein